MFADYFIHLPLIAWYCTCICYTQMLYRIGIVNILFPVSTVIRLWLLAFYGSREHTSDQLFLTDNKDGD